jgi:hypothetical protein
MPNMVKDFWDTDALQVSPVESHEFPKTKISVWI